MRRPRSKARRICAKRLVAEMRGRIKEDDSSVPQPDGAFAYFTRYREGGQHPLVCRQPRDGGPETIMLDGDQEGEGLAFFDLGGAEHSPDHRLLAWSADIKGSEYFTIRVRDLETGAELADEVPNAPAEAVWLNDSSGFYYVELDENHRPCAGAAPSARRARRQDEVIYEERIPASS